MTDISGAIVALLVFVTIMLVRFLWQQRTKIQPWEEALARAPRPAEVPPEPALQPALQPEFQPFPHPTSPPTPAAPPRPSPVPAAPQPSAVPGAHARPASGPRPLHEFGAGGSGGPRIYAAKPAGRRFSRQALFGDRRRTQNAVVAAVILGPCRASSAWDADR